MADRIRSHDWSATPLGPIADWPQSLKTAVALLVAAPRPVVLMWGQEGVLIYNDGYARFAGDRHPALLGMGAREGWPEIADFNDDNIRRGLAGEAWSLTDQSLLLNRRGTLEVGSMDLDYVPVTDDSGRPGGVMVFVTETTDRLLADRKSAEALLRLELALSVGRGVGTWEWDIIADRVVADTRFATIYGVDPNVARAGAPIADFFRGIHPDDAGRVQAEVAAAIETCGTFSSEYRLVQPGGDIRWVVAEGRVISDETGRPARFPGVTFDITDRKAQEVRQAALLELNDALRGLTDPAEVAAASSAILARALGVTRAGYGVMDVKAETVEIARDYNAPGMTSIAGLLKFRDFGSYIEDLARGETVAVTDTRTDPRTRDTADALAGIGVSSFINMPLTEHGKVVAIVFVNHVTPRAWSRGDIDLLREFADRVRTASERARAHEELDDSEARYRTLFNTMDEGFCIIEFFDGPHGPDSDYVHVEANPAYAANAGIENVVGQTLREMVGDEAQSWVDRYGAVLRTGQPIRFEQELVATGRWLELSAFRIEPPERKQVAVLFQDLTARKQAERDLQALNATLESRVAEAVADKKLFADIIESADAFVQVVDSDFRWLAINEASTSEFERIFGVRPKVGQKMSDALDHLPEHAAAVEAIWARAMREAPFIEVQEFGAPDRARRFYEMRYYPLLDPAGQKVGAYQIVYDVTERLAEQQRLKEAHEALRQSQKMEAVGQLTGGIAHDFNNLLAGISGSLELLGKRLNEGRLNGMERYIDAAQGSAQRAASLTQRLLAFSRRQTLDPKPTDVNRLINGMEDLIRRSVGPDVEVEVVGAGGLWPTQIDQSQLENALLNLCINARDAMAPNGGRLTIETANKWLDKRHAAARDLPPGQYVSLCVTDTGTGMTPEVQAQAFDPFFTTKPLGQGTGLGLSMIHGFVRQSGGQVRIYSELGKGTTMCLYLPRHMGELDGQTGVEDAPVAEGGHGETVLVIDDEETVRMLVAEVLGDAGYHVIEAPDGPSGLEILRSDLRIDLLISDVGLPGGMNGRQVADAARETRPDLKVLFITGYAENAAVGNGLLAPGMEVLTKPFVMADLALKVHEMIEA